MLSLQDFYEGKIGLINDCDQENFIKIFKKANMKIPQGNSKYYWVTSVVENIPKWHASQNTDNPIFKEEITDIPFVSVSRLLKMQKMQKIIFEA